MSNISDTSLNNIDSETAYESFIYPPTSVTTFSGTINDEQQFTGTVTDLSYGNGLYKINCSESTEIQNQQLSVLYDKNNTSVFQNNNNDMILDFQFPI